MEISPDIGRALGLTRREAQVYLALLELGESSVFVVAAKCGIPRATVYTLLSELERKELVGSLKKNRVLYFQAHHPSVFTRRLQEQLGHAERIVPMLAGLVSEGQTTPAVKFFTGRRGVTQALDTLYDGAEKRRVKEFNTLSHPELYERFPEYLGKLIERRQRLKIRTNLIVSGVDAARAPKHYRSDAFRETRFLPPAFSFYTTLIISDVESVLLSMHGKEIHAVLVTSKTITEMFHQLFQFVWKMLPRKQG